jgi:hypothetical protein
MGLAPPDDFALAPQPATVEKRAAKRATREMGERASSMAKFLRKFRVAARFERRTEGPGWTLQPGRVILFSCVLP